MRLRAVLGLGMTGWLACANPGNDPGASESPHTVGELAWGNDPEHWVVRRGEPEWGLADGDIVTPRLQAWIDRYDPVVREVVRKKSGKELAAPKPRIRLFPSPGPNANVAFLPACITPRRPTPGLGALATMLRPDVPAISRNDGDWVECVEAENWSAEDGLRWFNALGGTQVKVESDAIAVATEPSTRVQRAAIVSATPFINVMTGLVAGLSEKATAVVLAHELGHYYRSHASTSVAGRYDYWFERAEHLPERPLPAAEQVAFHFEYERLKPPRLIVAGQTYHPRAIATLLRWAAEMRPADGHPCADVRRRVDALTRDIREELLDADHPGLAAAAENALLEIEPAIRACAREVTLTDADAGDGVFATTALPRRWFVARIAPSLQPAGDLSSVATLAGLIEVLEQTGRSRDEEARGFLERLTKNHIGRYTSEQEADDIAMELAAALGIAPGETKNALLELAFAVERAYGPAALERTQGMSATECQALADAGFMALGREIYMPLGSLADPHHTLCYRVYNLHREQRAHAYVVALPNMPADDPPWSKVQAAAVRLHGPQPAPAPVPTPPSPPGPVGPGEADAGTPAPPGASPGEPSPGAATPDASDARPSSPESAPESSPESSPSPSPSGGRDTKTKAPPASGCGLTGGPPPTSSGFAALGFVTAAFGLLRRRRRR